MTQPDTAGLDARRAQKARQLIDDLLRCKEGGEILDDDEVLTAHRDLMPELGRELQKLRLITEARGLAERSSARNRAAQTGDGRATKKDVPPPDSFPGYDIDELIHRGGQGAVYAAVQQSTKRKVAIKVIREGPFAGSNDVARFEREVEILGSLNHPNIVTIHDSGTTAGHFYFVMDHIVGEPLDVFMGRGQVPVPETLRLFAQICEAVNAAHLRGVIHRDLKPGNIRIDSGGKPYVLDFGLAKFTTARDMDPTHEESMTMPGQFVGSLPWASPEQVECAPGTIDVRTDVYSLGVILYQMLTGQFPYAVVGTVREIMETIAQTPPRSMRALRREINDEVETIVLKCLSKEPDRRYQSAGDLLREVNRYLAGHAIEAKRDSTWYLIRKTVTRNKLPVALAVAFVGVLVLFSAAMTVMYRGSERMRAQAEREALRATRIQAFLEDMLGSIDPVIAQGGDITLLRKVLDQAADRIGTELASDPQVQASVRGTIGNAYASLGLLGLAEAQLSAALNLARTTLGEEHPETLRAACNHAQALWRQGRYAEAEALLRRTIRAQERVLGGEHADTLRSRNSLAVTLRRSGKLPAARGLYEKTLKLRRRTLGDDHPDTLFSMNNLAVTRKLQGELARAESLHRKALDARRRVLGDEHPDTLWSMHNLAVTLDARGRHVEAKELCARTLDVRRRLLGDEHPDTLMSMHTLAGIARQLGELEESEGLHRKTLALRRRVLGAEHPDTLWSMNNLANTLRAAGNVAEALELYTSALASRQRRLGNEHPDTLKVSDNLAFSLEDLGRLGEAEARHAEALEVRRRALGNDHRHVSTSLYHLARLREARGDLSSAETYFRESLAILRRLPAAKPQDVAYPLLGLGNLLTKKGDPQPAESFIREALEIRAKETPPNDYRLAECRSALGACLTAQRRFKEAEPLLLESYPIIEADRGTQHPRTREAAHRIVRLFEVTGRRARAATWQARRTKNRGSD